MKVIFTAPTKPGAYWFTCSENGPEPETAEITLRDGVLMVDLPSLGKYGVKDIHGGTTNPRWVKDATPSRCQKIVPSSFAIGTDDGDELTDAIVTVRAGNLFFVKASDPEYSGWMSVDEFRERWGVPGAFNPTDYND